MDFNIDHLGEDELLALNRLVIERLKFIRHARAHHAMLKFRPGELVSFTPEGRGTVRGVIVRYNQKTVTVLTPDGQQWRVSPGFLRKETGAAASPDAAPEQLKLSTD